MARPRERRGQGQQGLTIAFNTEMPKKVPEGFLGFLAQQGQHVLSSKFAIVIFVPIAGRC